MKLPIKTKGGIFLIRHMTTLPIGDNSVVGANAVVVKDVPPNCTVAGVPANIIKRDGQRVNEPLV